METTGAGPVELSKTLGQRITEQNGWGREKAFADAVLDQVRADRLVAVTVPTEHGGDGLSALDAARITFNISRVSPGAGMIYAMHMSQLLTLIRHAAPTPFFDDFQKKIVREQMLLGSITSEAGVGGDIFGSICTIEDLGGGKLSLYKDCPIISYFDLTGAFLITANRVDANGHKTQVLFLAEAGQLEYTSSPEMQLTGLRGVVNKSYKITARFDEAAILPGNFPAIQRETMTPTVNLLWSSVWSGMAWQAIDRAKRHLARQKAEEADVAPVMRHEISRLVNKHYIMNAIIRDAVAEYESNAAATDVVKGMNMSARNARLKILCSELVNEITQGALAIVGIGGYALEGAISMSEVVRDALSAPLQVSNYRLGIRNAKVERFLDEVL